jgi:hypothetical protein
MLVFYLHIFRTLKTTTTGTGTIPLLILNIYKKRNNFLVNNVIRI